MKLLERIELFNTDEYVNYGKNGFIEMYDFSEANLSLENRVKAVSQVASVCYGNDGLKPNFKLYDKLARESIGLPSSSFEFVPVFLKDSGLELIISEYLKRGITEHFKDDVPNVIRYGYHTERGLVTNLRALMYDLTYIDMLDLIESDLFLNNKEDAEFIKNNFFVFKIKATIRDFRQLLRHRRGSFQELCIAGDTLIQTSKGKRKIEDLYKQQYKKGTDGRLPKVKTYDFNLKKFVYAPIKEVFYTGKKKVYEVVIQYGSNGKVYKIKATKDHKFLTKSGWKRLKDIKLKEFLAINGQPLYRNKEWLKERKEYYIKQGICLKDWVKIEGFNYNTIRKWLRIHGLQYTPKEASGCYEVWNKGLKGKLSHTYGRVLNFDVREKISKKLVKPLGDTKQGWRKRVTSYWEADFRRNKILKKYNYKCVMCNSQKDLELDHIKPVSLYPELAFDENNIQILCKKCHQFKTKEEVKIIKQTIKYGMLISIKEVGEVDTYDIEVEHIDHNYVANGVVVHNSRRYTTDKKVPLEFRFNKELSKTLDLDRLVDNYNLMYDKLLFDGVKAQEARDILPVSLYSTLWVAFYKDGLKNFIDLRTKSSTQKELRIIAENMKELTKRNTDVDI